MSLGSHACSYVIFSLKKINVSPSEDGDLFFNFSPYGDGGCLKSSLSS